MAFDICVEDNIVEVDNVVDDIRVGVGVSSLKIHSNSNSNLYFFSL